MFFDRYTEDARRAVAMAKEEAASIGSPHIEAEHLLLGVARAVEPDLKELLRLKELEDTLRADLRDLPSWMDKADVGTVAVLTLDNGERLTAEVRILMTSGTNSLLTLSPATALIRTTVSEAVRFLSAALSLLSPDNVRDNSGRTRIPAGILPFRLHALS